MDCTIEFCNNTTEDKRVDWLMIPESSDVLRTLIAYFADWDGLKPEYEKRLEAFLANLEQGSGIREICLKTVSGRWFQIQWIPMEQNAGAVIREVTQERSAQILGQVCADKWEVLTVNPGLGFCVADLTDDEVLYCCPWIQLEGGNYEAVIRQMSEQFVDHQDDEVFQDMFSRRTLLAVSASECHQQGVVRAADGDAVKYINVRGDMMQDPYSGNTCVCLMLIEQKGLRETDAQLLERMERDSVTGTYNRAGFQKRFEERKEGGVLAAIRVNRMEQLNDALGTQRGDQILREMARTLSALLREGEIVGRCRGAEFIACLNSGEEELLKERLSIICTVLTRELEQNVKLRVSVGVVLMEQGDISFYDLYENAQLALRSIPNQGESAYAFYKPEMRERASRIRMALPGTVGEESRVFIRTFGFFDVFVDGTPLRFRGSQSKELMALLVDRRGGYLSSAEAIAYLWENEPANQLTLTRLRKVAMYLKRSLEEAGVADIIEFRGSMRRIVPERVQCDYYDFLLREGETSFPGNYMSNYSWAESTLANLLE